MISRVELRLESVCIFGITKHEFFHAILENNVGQNSKKELR